MTCGICSGQTNLAPNSSFETVDSCPVTYRQIYLASPWFQPNNSLGTTTYCSSSDIFNACSVNADISVPSNIMGYQNARTGNGFAGEYVDNNMGENSREYIEVPLSSSLIANKKYCVEFYVSLANVSQVATSSIGAYFSVDSLLQSTTIFYALDYVTPQIENPNGNYLNDTINWMLISGNFIATGGEKYMTIGNFNNPTNTNYQNLTWGFDQGAYYYIDDISVIDCTNEGISTYNNGTNINIFPNPVMDKLNVQVNNCEPTEIILYDLSSRKLLQQTFTNTTTINTEQLAKGMYLYTVRNGNGIIKNGKVIKQ